MSTEAEARIIVELLRAQNWKNGGVLIVDDPDAVALVVTALTVAEQRGVIEGINRMGAIADKAFAPSEMAALAEAVAMIFRLYHQTLGGHVHCRLFAGTHEGALGKCGDLVMRIPEFEAFKDCFKNLEFCEEQIA